jgi:hypothetical protein
MMFFSRRAARLAKGMNKENFEQLGVFARYLWVDVTV